MTKEIYYLNKNELPNIPVPHDCIIKDISFEEKTIVIAFEDDISYHDSIKYSRPNVKTLVVRYHLEYDSEDFRIYRWKKPSKIFGKEGSYKELDGSMLIDLPKARLEYLYHYIGYCSIIIKMWAGDSIILDANVDYVEYEWID